MNRTSRVAAPTQSLQAKLAILSSALHLNYASTLRHKFAFKCRKFSPPLQIFSILTGNKLQLSVTGLKIHNPDGDDIYLL